MPTNTVQSNIKVVPFFARFLKEQVVEKPDTASTYTFKYPSDAIDDAGND
ncbi:MAG: microviridin/marinostatin family tricyclic proteinase inhibitor [Nostoc sp. LLA-1]|nr:microviridin/marinostatin family tricyclic proteinase inhibitor [Cyanocohniella sp. LLY]